MAISPRKSGVQALTGGEAGRGYLPPIAANLLFVTPNVGFSFRELSTVSLR